MLLSAVSLCELRYLFLLYNEHRLACNMKADNYTPRLRSNLCAFFLILSTNTKYNRKRSSNNSGGINWTHQKLLGRIPRVIKRRIFWLILNHKCQIKNHQNFILPKVFRVLDKILPASTPASACFIRLRLLIFCVYWLQYNSRRALLMSVPVLGGGGHGEDVGKVINCASSFSGLCCCKFKQLERIAIPIESLGWNCLCAAANCIIHKTIRRGSSLRSTELTVSRGTKRFQPTGNR